MWKLRPRMLSPWWQKTYYSKLGSEIDFSKNVKSVSAVIEIHHYVLIVIYDIEDKYWKYMFLE